jgi:hypothetical protein
MLPLNALAHVRETLIDDFLAHDSCRQAEAVIKKHFSSYDAETEISRIVAQTEQTMSLLIDDCIILIAAAASRSSILNLIHKRVDVSKFQAARILAIAEFKWIKQAGQ